jgi:hypothetical protein
MMSIEFTLTKLIVADVEKLERFYLALGFKIVERRFGDKMTGPSVFDRTERDEPAPADRQQPDLRRVSLE